MPALTHAQLVLTFVASCGFFAISFVLSNAYFNVVPESHYSFAGMGSQKPFSANASGGLPRPNGEVNIGQSIDSLSYLKG